MNRTLIHKLIPFDRNWTINGDGIDFIRGGYDSQVTHVSFEQLKVLHQKLPLALELLKEHRKYADSTAILRVLRLWETDIRVPNMTGDMMVAIETIHKVDFKQVFVSISGQGMEYEEMSHTQTGESILIPGPVDIGGVLLRNGWLNEHFPGWRERFELAVQLDMSLMDAVRSMCQRSPVPEVKVLPDDLTP